MISRAAVALSVATCAMLINVTAALAAPDEGSDPTKIGDNAKDVVLPNAKAFWWICLVVGLLGMAATRKASRAGGIAAMLVISGIAIFNPAGAASTMQGLAGRII